MTYHDREHFDGKLALQNTAAGAMQAASMPSWNLFKMRSGRTESLSKCDHNIILLAARMLAG
jgi:hypothetical protein